MPGDATSDRDVAAIIDVTIAYCWAIDTRDWEALGRVFVPDATAVFGSRLLDGLDAITQRLERTLSRLDSSQHTVSTHQVRVDGDTATSRCYVHAQHVRAAVATDGDGPLYVVAGRYDDQLVRTDDGWRIAHRTLVPMWSQGNERVLRSTRTVGGQAPRGPASVDDFVAVQRLVHRYADAVVRRDAEQWGSCWADDAVWDLGIGPPAEGREAIVELWQGAMAGMAAVVQTVHNGDVYRDVSGGDDATAIGHWYVDERYRTTDGAAGLLLARYDDEYVRVDGRWLFARRRLVALYHGPPDLTAPFALPTDDPPRD